MIGLSLENWLDWKIGWVWLDIFGCVGNLAGWRFGWIFDLVWLVCFWRFCWAVKGWRFGWKWRFV